jgi:BirA family biotin operon repressor/biotin-[acetyl-CoA-carboxylase] ligase
VATGREWDRNRILADLLGGLERRYEDLLSGRQAALLADYRTRCSTLGAEVQVTSGDHRLFGRAADVDERGRLIVETDHQGRVPVEAGEVTLRA